MNSAFPSLNVFNPNENDFVTYERPAFYGAKARSGLHLTSMPDHITDFITDWAGISIEINGTSASPQEVEETVKYSTYAYDQSVFKDRYSEYFGSTSTVATSTLSKNNNSNRNLLIIGDSYLSPCARFYAYSFDKVVTVNQEQFEGSLSEVIEQNNITDVLFEQNDHRYSLTRNVTLLKKLLES